MLSVAKGYDTRYLTDAVSGGREGYYTGAVAAGEPAGLWYGAGAAVLGLAGEVDAELMEALYSHLRDPRHEAAHDRERWGQAPLLGNAHRVYRSASEVYADALAKEPGADPVRRAELLAVAERSARQAVTFFDGTFSAPKSVSVLGVAFERQANDARAAGDLEAAEAWTVLQRAVEDAVLAGARASVDYLQEMAGYSRVGDHAGSGGRWTDAPTFVVAQFLQHDSRDRDPQLHVHQAILNRVVCADGKWRAIDGAGIFAHKPAASAIGDRVMEAHLARSLGVRFATRQDGKAREVVGVSEEIRELFSSRRQHITARTAELERQFRDRNGRDPSPLERFELAQEATLATRARKSHDGMTAEERMDMWTAKAFTRMHGGLAQVAQDALSYNREPRAPALWSERDVAERALASIGDERASWSRSELLQKISDALPDDLGLAPEQIPGFLRALTDEAVKRGVRLTGEEPVDDLPEEAVLANGASSFARPNAEKYTTTGQLIAESVLRRAAAGRGAARVSTERAQEFVGRFATSGKPLNAAQAAALTGVLTSGARIETISAAAGTGKSFLMGALSDAWTESGRQMFGLASAEDAAQILTDEGVTSRNVAAWLATQRRLEEHRPLPEDEAFRLRPGAIIAVDEASMISTADLAAIQARCAAAGAKLLLVGDQRQLGAVGPGGAMADLVEDGLTYELSEVRRFTTGWEGPASLRLREGDTSVLAEYHRHGRLVSAGTAAQTEAAASRAFLADTLAGKESLLLVPTNEAAARISAALRAELVQLGLVQERGVLLGREGTYAGVGDVIQARRCGWELRGFEGNNTRAPLTRATYRVTALREDGGLTVTPVKGGAPIQLSAEYVTNDVTLAYANTVHAAQGRTVDTGHAIAGPGVDRRALYVMFTRGSGTNTVWTITQDGHGQAHDLPARTAHAVLADIMEAPRDDMSATAEWEQADAEARSIARHGDRMIERAKEVTAHRTSVLLDELAAEGALAPWDREALAADDSSWSLQRLLRTAELAGHDPTDVLTTAIAHRDLGGTHHPAHALYARIERRLRDKLEPMVSSFADLIPHGVPAAWRAWFTNRAAAADDRRRELGTDAAERAAPWAVRALGPVPADPIAREEWEHKVGWAAACRELTGHTAQDDPLGAAPPAALAEKHALWRTAHAKLDLPDAGDRERVATEGRLRCVVRAWDRERSWAPRRVADELAETTQAATRARADATVWNARASAAQDPAQAAHARAHALAAQTHADDMAARAVELEFADDTHAQWYVHTAPTRDAAFRARVELATRGINLDDLAERVTTEEWWAAHQQEAREEDAYRLVTDETDLHDTTWEQTRADADRLAPDHTTETAVPDIRDHSTPHPTEYADPTGPPVTSPVDDSAVAVTRAQTALAEMQARREYEHFRQQDQDENADELVSEC
ncbi:MAG: MobF family relaxase [Pseudonocardiaceae bacterium]